MKQVGKHWGSIDKVYSNAQTISKMCSLMEGNSPVRRKNVTVTFASCYRQYVEISASLSTLSCKSAIPFINKNFPDMSFFDSSTLFRNFFEHVFKLKKI